MTVPSRSFSKALVTVSLLAAMAACRGDAPPPTPGPASTGGRPAPNATGGQPGSTGGGGAPGQGGVAPAPPDVAPDGSEDGADGASEAGAEAPSGTLQEPGVYLPGFTATAPNKPLSIQVTFSGETLGSVGLPFPQASVNDPPFVDGWAVDFDLIIGVVGNVRLSPGATRYPTDQKRLDPVLAIKTETFVLDFANPSGHKATDGRSPAGGVFIWDRDDKGVAFDPNARYAFSYDVVPAAYPAVNVNLAKEHFADYDTMVKRRWTKFVRGRATYNGTGKHPDAEAQKRFDMLPKTVHFSFGWNDAGSVINCINPALDRGGGGEPGTKLANRGVQVTAAGPVNAQITFHAEHLFWNLLKVEYASPRFDHIAAWAPADTSAAAPFDLATLKKPLAATFADGYKLPDRGPFQGVTGYQSPFADPAQMIFGTGGVPEGNVPNLASFLAFAGQASMHLGTDGVCYVVGQQAADPLYKPGL